MRLIDADKFQRDLSIVWKWLVERNKAGYGTTHGEMLDKVHDILSTQPTAYDVDKVVEELEDEKKFWSHVHFNQDIAREKSISYEHAIEIVKDGGKNDNNWN